MGVKPSVVGAVVGAVDLIVHPHVGSHKLLIVSYAVPDFNCIAPRVQLNKDFWSIDPNAAIWSVPTVGLPLASILVKNAGVNM